MRTATRFLVVAALGVAAASCGQKTGLNIPCTLVKKDPADSTGQKSTFITVKDVKANAARDVISFGAVECEDLVCVHEGGAALPPNDGDPVTGWCSRPCLETATNACTSDDPALDKNPTTAFSCRKMLLDEAALASLRTTDPGAYKKYFGDTTSPFFCARTPAAEPSTSP